MFRLTFDSLFNLDKMKLTSTLSIDEMLYNVLFSLGISIFITWIYKKTFTGVLYSKNFSVTLVMVSMVTSMIVMAIAGNIALALGMVGALSIVRFRTPIKDPRDTGYLFWSITNGIICGVSAYLLAVVAGIFIGVAMFLLTRKVAARYPYLLILNFLKIDEGKLKEILKEYCSVYKYRSTTKTDDKTEMTVEVRIKHDSQLDFIENLKGLSGVAKVMIISYEGDLTEA